jgi:hypothetical protein
MSLKKTERVFVLHLPCLNREKSSHTLKCLCAQKEKFIIMSRNTESTEVKYFYSFDTQNMVVIHFYQQVY